MSQRTSNCDGIIARAEIPQDELALLVGTNPAPLSNNPCTLMCLREEYKFSINGRKPAEKFTTYERNTNTNIIMKYWRRDIISKYIARLTRGGHTAQTAIIQIQNVYGYHSSVTTIVKRMVREKWMYQGGVHPNLV